MSKEKQYNIILTEWDLKALLAIISNCQIQGKDAKDLVNLQNKLTEALKNGNN